MIHWLWLIPAHIAGVFAGLIILSCLITARRADDAADQLAQTLADRHEARHA